MEMETNPISQSLGTESGRTGGLADTRVYKEVAMSKLTTKQNLIYLWWLWGYMRG
jgi:hypothetical protein